MPRGWCTRDHLAAIHAVRPAGKLSCRGQDHPINADDVVAFLEPLRREVPGRVVIVRDFLATGAGQRLHLERLPAYAPELNPGEGLWHQLKGVELRHVCCFNSPQLRSEWRDAVKRVRRRPRLIASFFRGAKLQISTSGSVSRQSLRAFPLSPSPMPTPSREPCR
jgi:transposase